LEQLTIIVKLATEKQTSRIYHDIG
jgi:hypothetical protein